MESLHHHTGVCAELVPCGLSAHFVAFHAPAAVLCRDQPSRLRTGLCVCSKMICALCRKADEFIWIFQKEWFRKLDSVLRFWACQYIILKCLPCFYKHWKAGTLSFHSLALMIIPLSCYIWQTKTEKREREKNKKLAPHLVISINNAKYIEYFFTKLRTYLVHINHFYCFCINIEAQPLTLPDDLFCLYQ